MKLDIGMKLENGTKVKINEHVIGVYGLTGEIVMFRKDLYLVMIDKSPQYGRSWELTPTLAKQLNLEDCFLGRYFWWAERIKLEVISVPKVSTKKPPPDSEINRWKNFVYGRQIQAEEDSLPPIKDRGLEFL